MIVLFSKASFYRVWHRVKKWDISLLTQQVNCSKIWKRNHYKG